MTAASACPVCGHNQSSVAHPDPRDYEYGVRAESQFQYLRCESCASEFLYPRPAATALTAFYPREYHAYNEDDHGAVAALLVAARERVRGRRYRGLLERGHGRLFDVGTGDCRHFASLERYCRLECAGVEINPELAARARARGYAVATGTLEEFDTSSCAGTFDLVSMNHVLEHVVEPRLVLAKALELLKPGGHLLGQLPAVDSWERRLFGRVWGGYHFPRHLQAFSRQALRAALERSGFQQVAVTSAPHLQTAISVQNWLVDRGWVTRMRYGKCRLYSGLLLAVSPFELAAYLAGRSGIVNFSALKPARSR